MKNSYRPRNPWSVRARTWRTIRRFPPSLFEALTGKRAAIVAVVLTVFVMAGTGLRLATWEDGVRLPPQRISATPVDGSAYKGSVAELLDFEMRDDVGLLERLGAPRHPIVTVRLSALINRATKDQDHSWRISLPKDALSYRLADHISVKTKGGLSFTWEPGAWVDAPPGGVLTIRPNIFWIDNSEIKRRDFGYSLLAMDINMGTLSAGRVFDGEPAELWQLEWSNPGGSSANEIRYAGEGGLSGLQADDPLGDAIRKGLPRDYYQITACPSCLGINSYGKTEALDMKMWAVAGNWDEEKRASYTTPAYPWSWLYSAYWWLVPLALAPAIFWIGKHVWRRAAT